MRLSKKIAAVALAAVMSVSVLTACGGTDAPSSSSPSNSSGSSSSSSSDSSSGSGSSSGSDSSSGSTSDSSSSGSGSSSNSGTEDKEESVAYKNSRTARFYERLGTSYTLGTKLEITTDGNSQLLDMLVVTNGSRTYQQTTVLFDGVTENQTMTLLIDQTKQKEWQLSDDESVKEQGKLGYCWSATISGTSTDSGVFKPNSGLKFKKETKGNYYIETQAVEGITEGGKVKTVIAYYYKGNSIVPEYAKVEESFGSEETLTVRITFTHVEYKADAKYLDFESILKQYIDITDQIPKSTAQAMNPSIAGLNIG